MGFREDATTVELQTWYAFSLVKAEFPAHLTLNKNEAYISIYYKNNNLLILYREQAKNLTFWNTKQAGWLFFKEVHSLKIFSHATEGQKYFTADF